MKDALSCEKCGTIFPWNQLHLRWKHKCTGSVAKGKRRLPRSTQPRDTGTTTMRRSGESDSQSAANDEDAPSCEKCGTIFPWNQLHLRWKHKCTGSVAKGKRLPRFTQPRDTGTTTMRRSGESDSQSAANDEDAPSCEKCGTIFPWNQMQLRWKHKCTGSVAKGETLPRFTQPRDTRTTTMRRSGESDSQSAANDEDAPSCEKCGTIFPWNQLNLRWTHKCTGSVAKGETLPRFTQPRDTRTTTMRRSGESDSQSAANDEDAHKCEKCGQIFPWNQRGIRVKQLSVALPSLCWLTGKAITGCHI